jgi:Holliday junction resolvase RusA-like endonuclease
MTIPTGRTFFVPGIPAPGGSKKGFVNPKTKRVVIVDDCSRNKDWRASVALAGSQQFSEPLQGPLSVEVVFYMPRPKGHFRANGTRKPAAPEYPTTKPDTTKLWRSTEDALTGIAWMDDSQVVEQYAIKLYGARPGARISIAEMRKEQAA